MVSREDLGQELDRFKYIRAPGERLYLEETHPALYQIMHYKMLHPWIFSCMSGLLTLSEIFSTKLERISQLSSEAALDPMNSYRTNSYGYRGDEFPGKVDLIVSGCSQTVGVGVPEEATWHEFLASSMGVSHVALAGSGWSIKQMVNSILWYIRKYGKPKTIALLLPDFTRDAGPLHASILENPEVLPPTTSDVVYFSKYDVNAADTYPKMSKRPHRPTDVMPPELPVYHSAQALSTLIEFCRIAEIEIVWASWNNTAATIVEILNEIRALAEDELAPEGDREFAQRIVETGLLDTSGFFDLNLSTWNNVHIEKLKNLSCHSDLKDKYQTWFDVGTDEQKHYGVHAHAHVAEAFEEKLKEVRR